MYENLLDTYMYENIMLGSSFGRLYLNIPNRNILNEKCDLRSKGHRPISPALIIEIPFISPNHMRGIKNVFTREQVSPAAVVLALIYALALSSMQLMTWPFNDRRSSGFEGLILDLRRTGRGEFPRDQGLF